MDDLESLEVYTYKIKGPYIYVYFLNNHKKEKILYTKENEQKILRSMEKRIKEENEKYNSIEEKTFFEKLKKSVLNTSLFSILLSGVILCNFTEPGYSQFRANTILIITSILHLFASGLYETFNVTHLDTFKFNLFFKNKEEINEYVKKNPQLLDNIKSKSKESIIKNIEEKKENPVNVNNIDSMKLKELKELVQKIKFYKESNIDTAEDIINDGLDELKEQYDSVEVEKPKGLSYRRTNS